MGYFDHECPNAGHIEMVGPEFHIGISLARLDGSLNESLILSHTVPKSEIRVDGEVNPVRFAPCEIKIELSVKEAQDFAATIQQSYS